jgi:hypothetical protein
MSTSVDRSETVVNVPMSVTAFFEYLDEHDAATNLAQTLGELVMLRTCGARRSAPRGASNEERPRLAG